MKTEKEIRAKIDAMKAIRVFKNSSLGLIQIGMQEALAWVLREKTKHGRK